MSSTLIAVVLALALGHYVTPLAQLRRYGWFSRWVAWLGRQMGAAFASPFALILVLGVPLALTAWLQHALSGQFLGLAGFAFAVLALGYCWGPRDLDRDVEAIEEASDDAARERALAQLTDAARPASATDPASLVQAVFHAARRRWFGVLLWFLLLGPFGALLYRLTERGAGTEAGKSLPPAQLAAWQHLLAILDWPVAHLMTLALAVVGHFDAVRAAWREWHGARSGQDFDFSIGFLDAAAQVSVRQALREAAAEREADDIDDDASQPADAPLPLQALHAAMAQAWRILVAWIVVLALFVLAGHV
ncbi:MAG: hypothetical protein AB7D30_00730 [Lysobacteraceae bacterium]